ncbi:hypothetical protein EHI8A_094190 [Entamoeba histolytica HM-1:IMSS-B]|uniref:Uncharacterized protein n=4 Tax=Entamoeba histolytica TaxID=5759 RepID=C4LSS3_ENTH1|nr:hypothetical protein EHI_152360 [Entamoeba histolytica HM-1:IMSS]EAL51593.1 hypothetical protein EHI_152360 [Entamoeba histolytica HM-1:IMSS]EMH75459.1 hypothetical protein EHI8A_094190 [Entamoeba histolytica HM-1:IMSS-B]ENY64499.1 hypothetical protein EHI7A_090320 [Entamoeba histolytica HM-1:IMSS-A]GAT91488.1 hypothetical protein CL6EHI_152360 [Entamoeba histolytica]|eukprot:XP_656975.1 hypothetical protein EHI_152360 [Entamoeba histolytica HM-1:IMSS]
MDIAYPYSTDIQQEDSLSDEKSCDEEITELKSSWEKCLSSLPKEQRKLIKAYVQYKSEKVAKKIIKKYLKEQRVGTEKEGDDFIDEELFDESLKYKKYLSKKEKKREKKMLKKSNKNMKYPMFNCYQKPYPIVGPMLVPPPIYYPPQPFFPQQNPKYYKCNYYPPSPYGIPPSNVPSNVPPNGYPSIPRYSQK